MAGYSDFGGGGCESVPEEGGNGTDGEGVALVMLLLVDTGSSVAWGGDALGSSGSATWWSIRDAESGVKGGDWSRGQEGSTCASSPRDGGAINGLPQLNLTGSLTTWRTAFPWIGVLADLDIRSSGGKWVQYSIVIVGVHWIPLVLLLAATLWLKFWMRYTSIVLVNPKHV